MKWMRFRIRTNEESEDIIISYLEDIGLEGAQIEQLATCGVQLSEGAQKLFDRFNGFRKTFSELQQEFQFKAPELLAILTELEISGLVTSKDNFQFYFNGA